MTDDAMLVRQVALTAIALAEAAGADQGATNDLRRMLSRLRNQTEPSSVEQEPQQGEAA